MRNSGLVEMSVTALCFLGSTCILMAQGLPEVGQSEEPIAAESLVDRNMLEAASKAPDAQLVETEVMSDLRWNLAAIPGVVIKGGDTIGPAAVSADGSFNLGETQVFPADLSLSTPEVHFFSPRDSALSLVLQVDASCCALRAALVDTVAETVLSGNVIPENFVTSLRSEDAARMADPQVAWSSDGRFVALAVVSDTRVVELVVLNAENGASMVLASEPIGNGLRLQPDMSSLRTQSDDRISVAFEARACVDASCEAWEVRDRIITQGVLPVSAGPAGEIAPMEMSEFGIGRVGRLRSDADRDRGRRRTGWRGSGWLDLFRIVLRIARRGDRRNRRL